ncbi:Peroxisomal acyl-coenzyme A oxidase 1 [Oopsacas minuta]|uniref:Acyl-coenzyme A oxidase n=1 Tax=Oopsacas minuta TaxID=111878 RepID=A0AAV7JYN3_9METZ|nr:Peroxisomal acyl-coenzyme A oxidase 1 [Oopsacas minuta]
METIAAERKASKLATKELTYFLYGGEEMVLRKREIENAVISDPTYDITKYHYLTREELFEQAVKKSVHSITKLMPELDILGVFERHSLTSVIGGENPLSLHTDMFMPTITGQGSDEQQEKWLPLATNYKIIGCYAQTEMGHGTYVRGLETTATYDPVKQEFDIHSPTLTSIKWWPGTLGVNATHAIVPARLITKGEDKGIHNFIVQLRSLDNHTAMKGITIGDIGPKFGYAEMDNGFLKFEHVRIPRDNLLMRFSQVLPDGTYVRPKTSSKLSYGTMVLIRAGLSKFSFEMLSRALTIAIRYSIVRRQTQNRPGEAETQLLDYVNQQHTLITLLATVFGIYFVSQDTIQLYVKTQSQLNEENMELLPELHASSSGVKAISTNLASQGIETCRIACGGHGYSLSSGFPFLYQSTTPSMTYEGDNNVLLLQTARYLIKIRKEVQEDPSYSPPDNVNYLTEAVRPRNINFRSPQHQLALYQCMVRACVDRAATKVSQGEKIGLDYFDAWNAAAVELIQCAEAHTHYVMVKSFIENIDKEEVRNMSPYNQFILKCLSDIFSLNYILNKSGLFIEAGAIYGRELNEIREVIQSQILEVRPAAVSLVDAFDYPDFVLRSVLGRKDGDVYTAMWEWVQHNPRNKHKNGVHPVYKKYTRKLLRAKM